MSRESAFLLAGVIVVVCIVQYRRGFAVAKDTAHEWLAQHHYRVRSFRSSWLGIGGLAGLHSRSKRAFTFVAEVDDASLGGTGKIRLRVWTDWLGKIDPDVEVDWISMPAGGADAELL